MNQKQEELYQAGSSSLLSPPFSSHALLAPHSSLSLPLPPQIERLFDTPTTADDWSECYTNHQCWIQGRSQPQKSPHLFWQGNGDAQDQDPESGRAHCRLGNIHQ